MATRKRPLDEITGEIAQTKQKLCDLREEKHTNVQYMSALFPDVIVDRYITTGRLTYYKIDYDPCEECDNHGTAIEAISVVVVLDGKMHQFYASGADEWRPYRSAFDCRGPRYDDDHPRSSDEAVTWKYLLECNKGNEAKTFATLAVLTKPVGMTPKIYFFDNARK